MTDLTKQLQNMREEYEGTPLRKNELNSCPFVQFSAWLLDAQKEKIPDPNACSLCTVDSDSKPMSRAVLLKGIEEEKFIFYTNYIHTYIYTYIYRCGTQGFFFKDL